jgi:hypothetical protein
LDDFFSSLPKNLKNGPWDQKKWYQPILQKFARLAPMDLAEFG